MVEKKKVVAAAENVDKKAQATPKRIIAVIFWLLGIACEAVAILLLFKVLYIGDENVRMYWMLGLIVADLIFVIIGSQFWKKANYIDPASEKNKVAFFFQNQMGLVVSVLAFLPLVVLLLLNKDLDKKTKKIVTIAAVIGLAIASAASIDYHPVSAEQKASLISEYGTTEVYWTRWGHSYHTSTECPSLSRTTEDNLFSGTIEQAIEAGRTDACDFCVDQTQE